MRRAYNEVGARRRCVAASASEREGPPRHERAAGFSSLFVRPAARPALFLVTSRSAPRDPPPEVVK